MKRVHVTGNAGVGKSTLAAAIGSLLGLPVYGLDRIVWQPGWRKTDPQERTRLEQALVDKDSWVIDGVSGRVREAADTIIFLDFARRVSFWRCAKRNHRYLFRSRPGLPDKCPEILIAPRLARLIWRFPTVVRPEIMADLHRYRAERTVVHVTAPTHVAEVLGVLSRQVGGATRSCQARCPDLSSQDQGNNQATWSRTHSCMRCGTR